MEKDLKRSYNLNYETPVAICYQYYDEVGVLRTTTKREELPLDSSWSYLAVNSEGEHIEVEHITDYSYEDAYAHIIVDDQGRILQEKVVECSWIVSEIPMEEEVIPSDPDPFSKLVHPEFIICYSNLYGTYNVEYCLSLETILEFYIKGKLKWLRVITGMNKTRECDIQSKETSQSIKIDICCDGDIILSLSIKAGDCYKKSREFIRKR